MTTDTLTEARVEEIARKAHIRFRARRAQREGETLTDAQLADSWLALEEFSRENYREAVRMILTEAGVPT